MHEKTGTPLSLADELPIINLYEKGCTYPEIRAQTGRAHRTINECIKHSDVKRRLNMDRSEQMIERIRKMKADGWPDKSIASHVGMHWKTVGKLRKKHGIPNLKRDPNKCRKVYLASVSDHGTIGKRRWEADKFDAFIDGAPIGLTSFQWGYLKLLIKNGPMTGEELAAATNNKRHMVLLLMYKLIRRGFVKKGRRGNWNVYTSLYTPSKEQEDFNGLP